MNHPSSHPILTSAAAREWEARLLGGDEAKEWPAMQRAGRAIAAAVQADFMEIGGLPAHARLLVLVGKGHNGGDALIATQALLEAHPAATAEVVLVFGERTLRPLAGRAWREPVHSAGGRVTIGGAGGRERGRAGGNGQGYDVCLDGIFGFQFRPPAEPRVAELIARVNRWPIRLRAAVDLPSAGLFQADFTYAAGILKQPVMGAPEAGRPRYLDLGFFSDEAAGEDRVLTKKVLAPLRALRAAHSDKRSFGHVMMVGGSRSYPGAILMTVLAALRSGAGLVTAFVPEALAPAFAARAPEAMWVGWPETPNGGLALEGEHLLRGKIERASALVLGPGMGREPETLALAASIAQASTVPLVVDADALQPEVVRAGRAPRIVTPHAGEFARIKDAVESDERTTLVLKGAVTRLRHAGSSTTYHSLFGGPVLARGGSGDLLAGLIGGLLAQTPSDPLLAAARGVVWHGSAADSLARAHGQVAVDVTQLLDFLPAALRESGHEPAAD